MQRKVVRLPPSFRIPVNIKFIHLYKVTGNPGEKTLNIEELNRSRYLTKF